VITAYLWTVLAGGSPWFAPLDMWASVVPEQPAVNANQPVVWDPDGTATQTMILDAYNRVVAPDPPAVPADLEFVDPPPGYLWPAGTTTEETVR
jgi:hypothetical protein